ncbi:MAG TPA: hypothetical protein DDW85_11445 [Porphyromonadaceae bacterium]|nr:hypothetical protein [Porphyromonadaceae bacterium]
MEKGKTFRSVLAAYFDTEEELVQIENALPLLNIYLPDLSIFSGININARTWDTAEEVPVAYSDRNDGTVLFFNGDSVQGLARDEVPGFPLLLVKGNERLHKKSSLTRGADAGYGDYAFIDPAFDGSLPKEIDGYLIYRV